VSRRWWLGRPPAFYLTSHAALAATIAPRVDLIEQKSSDVLTLAPPVRQIGKKWVERSCPTTAAEEVGSNLGRGEAIDRFTVQPEPSRYCGYCESLIQQLMDFSVPSLGPVFQSTWRERRRLDGRHNLRRDARCFLCFQFPSDYGEHPHSKVFQRISQVVDQSASGQPPGLPPVPHAGQHWRRRHLGRGR